MTQPSKPEETLQVAVGDLVAGKYRVDRVLGRGAMGVVVAARHEELGQKVAIKLLHPDVSASDDGRERFLREARAAAKLESDHVARVFDVGTFGETNAYLVMEHLEGCDLEKYLEAQGALPFDEAVDYVLEALEALAHAHAHGMVHRDIKPSNLFLTQRMDGTRRVKILDFGISKTESGLGVSSPGSSTLTSPHAVLGSPAYMAPEQIRSSKTVDQRADIWSVGVMLYELVTGKSPFIGETIGDTLARVLAGKPELITKFRPDAPKELVFAINTCLECDEKNRFQNVAELARALAPLGSSRTKDLPDRIVRVLGAKGAPPPRAIIPSDVGAHVNAVAETLAASPGVSSGGTHITATSHDLKPEASRSSRPLAALAILAVAGAAAFFFVKLRSETEIAKPATSERVSFVPEAPTQKPPALAVSQSSPPEIVPVATPSAMVHAAADTPTPAASHSSSLGAQTPAGKPLTKSSASPTKTTPTPNSTYPSGLLDGRD